MRELFIYYQVPAAQADTARAIVDAFQARLRERVPGLATRLLRRPVAPPEPETWMEVYARPGDNGMDGGVDDAVEAAIAAEAAALDGFLIGRRHVEVFAPCA